jgi:hypothetical protein
MGDPRRFHLMANCIREHFPDRHTHVADVASGHGALQAALRQLGYRHITSWDKRQRNAKNRLGYRYGWFDYRKAPSGYGLVVGMHPDEGTDHGVLYAVKYRVPFVICPCCITPSGSTYWGRHDFDGWCTHLMRLATSAHFSVQVLTLTMAGRNVVLMGTPEVKK